MSFTVQPEKDGASRMQVLWKPQFISFRSMNLSNKNHFHMSRLPCHVPSPGVVDTVGGTRTRSTSTRPNRST